MPKIKKNSSSLSWIQKIKSRIDLSRIDTRHQHQPAPRLEQIGVWEWDLVTDLVYFSPALIKLHGCGVNNALQTPDQATQFIHPDDCAQREALLARLRSGELEQVECEYQAKKSDGSWGMIFERSHSIRNNEGHSIRLVGCAFEVSADDQEHQSVVEELRKLKELSERLHNVLEFSSIGTWEWLFHDERLVWDKKMHEIYGVDRNQFRGNYKDWYDRIHPDDLERVMAEDQVRAETNKQLAQEFRIIRPSGKVRHIYSNVFTELDTHGQPVHAIGINVDITDRREAEFALLETESKLQTVADHLPGIVCRFYLNADGTNGWRYISSQVRELFGIQASDLMADAELLWQLIDPNDLERLRKRRVDSANDLSRYAEEFRITAFDNSTRWFHINSRPQKAENGCVVWDGVIHEITERKIAEIELQEAKFQLERITENVPGMIFRQVFPAKDGRIDTFVSTRSFQMFGVDPAQALVDPSRLWSWVHPQDIEFLTDSIDSSVKNLEPLTLEYRVVPPNESTRWYHITGQPEKLENGSVTLDGVVLDITDRKETELANDILAKATKTKDAFLANMSHELRTPLTAILATTDGLQQGMFGDISSRQVDCLKIVEQSSEHLLDLINEILELAKIESGQSELDLSAINVSRLCESCLNLVAPQAEQKQIELSLKVPWNLPMLRADEKRVRQILSNLLWNAVKFTPQGGKVILEVETRSENETGLALEALRFSVSDTGIGIKADKLKVIFDPFFQIDSSLTRRHGGSGLGLSLVRQLVESHGGIVGVTSEPDRGSCFTVDLPFQKSRSDQIETSSASEDVSAVEALASASHIDSAISCAGDDDNLSLILLAEDNDLVAESIVSLLEFSKFRVLRAANGKLAVEMARDYSPDLILMDIQMPEMDGFEATRQIRAIAEFAQLPIIATSGFARAEDSQRSIEAGMNSFMAKPLRIEELVNAINSMLQEQAKTPAVANQSSLPGARV